MTSQRISPKAFGKAYEAEKREQSRMFEKERRRMHYKKNGWSFLRYLTETNRQANSTRFRWLTTPPKRGFFLKCLVLIKVD